MLSQITESPSTGPNSKKMGRRFYYGWVALAVCLILLTTSYGIRYSFGVFFQSLEQEFGWTRALTSGVFSLYMLFCTMFAFLGGWATDRYGARKVVFVLGIFSFISLSLTSRANTLWYLFFSYSLLLAIGTGPVYAIVMATATRWFKKNRGLAVAIVGSGVGLSTWVMAPTSAILIEDYGWRNSYLILALIALFIFLPCALLLKKTPNQEAAPANNKRQDNAKANPPGGQNPNEPKEFSLGQATRTKTLWLLFGIWFTYAACFFIITTHVVRHAIDLGIAPVQASFLLSIVGFASIPARIFMGIASDHFGRKLMVVISALAMAAAMLWLTQATDWWMLWVFAAVFGVANGGLAPPLLAIVGDTFGARNIGAIFGVLEISWAAGAALTPALAGYIFDITGSYNYAFLFGMIAALAMIVLILLIRHPTET